jgi:hypothetical protein
MEPCGFQTYVKLLFGLSVASLFWVFSASACSCDGGILDCSYASADIVFRGTVDFNNDDGTGTFVQQTFIRFQVSERFKGLPSGTKHVWVDPGSFTSCYAEYRRGEEYLVFAMSPLKMSANTAAVTIVRGTKSSKPLPKELTAPNPPTVYLAPECTGTRDTHYPDFDQDLVSLRRYAAGAPVASIMGQVLLYPHDPWSGKGRLADVDVLLETGKGIRHSTTNSEGKFFFDEPLENGSYTVITRYPGTDTERAVLPVYSRRCSNVFLFLRPTAQPQKH